MAFTGSLRNRGRRFAVLTAFLCGTLIIGCGGSDGDTTADGPPPCGDERNELLKLYEELELGLDLNCESFTKTRGGQYFKFSEMVGKGEYEWALIRDPLIVSPDKDYGLNLLRAEYGAPRAVNSGFRDPAHNKKIGGAKRSRHQFGDAVDLRNVTRSQEEWDRMWMAAYEANADYIEPLNGPCKLNCLHADWRNHDGGYGP